MDPGEQTTGTRDEQYNLVSVLYHALHGAETIEEYILDAQAAGDERLAEFFREAQETHRQLAERAKELLGIAAGGVRPEVGGGAMAGTAPLETEVPPDTEPVDVRGRTAPEVGIPPEGAVTPGTAPEDVPPEPGIRTGEVGVPAEEVPPTTGVPRGTPPDTALRPEEDVVAEPRGVTPDEVQRGTSPERPPAREAPPAGLAEDAEISGGPRGGVSETPQTRETPGEPGRAMQEQRADRQTEGEQEEEKGLIDKVKDALTGQEESDRQRGQ